MLGLRVTLDLLTDERRPLRARQAVARALKVQKPRGNRAVNQAIIDEVGIDVQPHRREDLSRPGFHSRLRNVAAAQERPRARPKPLLRSVSNSIKGR
jgi:hypothetical protein